MTERDANIFKGVILAFGLVVYAIAFALMSRGRQLSAREVYLWVMIGVVYLAFFIPVLFNGLTFGHFAYSAAGVVLMWNATIVFCFVSIVLSLMVYYGHCSIALAIVAELAMVFVALILLFISAMAGGHIRSVGAKEAASFSKIKAMRSSFDSLNLKAQSAAISEETKGKIAKLAEEARYVSPVDSAQSASLEGDIIAAIGEAGERLNAVIGGAEESGLRKSVADLEMKVAQRKLLRN